MTQEMTSLASRAQQGDKDALGELLGTYYADLYDYARQIVMDEELAKDITQDSCETICKKIKTLKEPGAFMAWARQIVHRKCNHYFRDNKVILVDENEDGETIFDSLPTPDLSTMPEQVVEDKDFQRVMRDLINDLSAANRTTMLLYYGEGHSIKEIAKIQGISENTVKSQLRGGRKAFEAKLLDYEKKNNVKLHSLVPLPLLLYFLFQAAKAESAAGAGAFAGIGALTGTATGAGISAGSAIALSATGATVTTAAVVGATNPELTKKVVAGVVSVITAVGSLVAGPTTPATTVPIINSTPTTSISTTVPTTAPIIPDYYSEGLEFTYLDATNSYAVSGIGTCTDANLGIPDTYNNLPVTEISQEAFLACQTIESVFIPSSISNIGDGAFIVCEHLSSFHVDKNNPSYASVDGVLFTKDMKQLVFCPLLKSGDYQIPDGVISINDSAFSDCRNITSLAIPGSVSHIGEHAFSFMNGIISTNISVSADNPHFVVVDHVLFSKDMTRLVSCQYDEMGNYQIPDTVTTIDASAFSSCCALTSITIPHGVTNIATATFDTCMGLTSVTIPQTVTNFEYMAFYFCESLTDIYFQGTMEQWNAIAKGFNWDDYTPDYTVHCTDGIISKNGAISQYSEGLEYTYLNATNSYAVSGIGTCTDLDVAIPSTYNGLPVTSVADNAFADCWNLTSITVPAGVTTIGNNAFYYCEELKTVTLPSGITSIGDSAFYFCNTLQSINIPDSVTYIGPRAFYRCADLTQIHIPNGLTAIEDSVFFECHSLTEVDIPLSVTSTGDCAFFMCINLTSVTIYDNAHMDSIGMRAFYECSSLTDFTIPNGVTVIEKETFFACYALSSVSIPATVNTIKENALGSNLEHIAFDGTTEQWNTITKEDNWDSNSSGYTVYCADSIFYDVLDFQYQEATNSYAVAGISDLDLLQRLDKTLIIPGTYNGMPVQSIARDAFANVDELDGFTIILSENITTIEPDAFLSCQLAALQLPESLTTMEESALREIDLDYLYIPKNVTKIDFYGLTSSGLRDVEVAPEHPTYSCENGMLMNKSKTHLYLCLGGKTGICTIPSSITSMESFAFSYCPYIEEFVVDNSSSLLQVKDGVLYSKDGKTMIRYPAADSREFFSVAEGVTSLSDNAFGYCRYLKNVVLPAGLTAITVDTFIYCYDLVSITIPDSVTKLEAAIFNGCNMLTDIQFAGTMAQWSAITKDELWDYDISNYVIHCTDGDIPKA